MALIDPFKGNASDNALPRQLLGESNDASGFARNPP